MSSEQPVSPVEAPTEKGAGTQMKTSDVTVPISNNELPPTYDAANTGDVPPPPSYDSLYEKIKGAKTESTNPASYVAKVCSLLIGTLCVTIMMAMFLAIPITMIVLGALNTRNCPAESQIPFYLIVMGSMSLVKSLVDLKLRLQKRLKPEEERENFRGSRAEMTVTYGLSLAMFGYFIAGNVWIYRTAWPNMTDPLSPEYCDPTLYYFAFWITTSAYIIAGLGCFCTCGAACMGAATAKDRA